MAVTEELVLEELKKVIDPELFVNIVDLGLIYKVEIEPADASPADNASPSDRSVPSDSEATGTSEPNAEPNAESTATNDSGSPPSESQDATAESAAVEHAPCNIAIEMTLTSPMCPAGPQLVGQTKQYVSDINGVQDVEVKVVMDPPWSTECMSDDARDQLNIW